MNVCAIPTLAMDADVETLERALEAVKARSTHALANEESYLARIKELERMNRALVTQVASLPGVGSREFGEGRLAPNNDRGGVTVEANTGFATHDPPGNGSREGSPSRRHHRTPSYKTLRDKTNRLSVERVELRELAGVVGLGGNQLNQTPSLDSPNGTSDNNGSTTNTVDTDVSQLANTFATQSVSTSSLETVDPKFNDEVVTRPRIHFKREDSDASLFSNGENTSNSKLPEKKAPFQLLLCNDDGCEVHTPEDRAIRRTQIGTPHSQFAWLAPPKNVLIVKKPNDKNTTSALVEVVRILQKKNITPWVEPAVHWETGVGVTWQLDDDPGLDKKIDFIICLGGDGTILWVSNLFPKAVPPVISFAMGSLGFLTAFDEFELGTAIDDVVRGEFFFTPRSRLCAYVVDANGVEESAGDTQVCLNEIVVDRGASAALVDLDVNIDGNPMTKVLADGILISTPTGSTAYSLAAGGSMVHPGVSGVLFVPICPHTLSFRPLVLPDTSVLTITVPESARVEPVASFDGKKQRTLRRGESLVVKGWRYPVPAICKAGETKDWFKAVKNSLLWNVRGATQKAQQGN